MPDIMPVGATNCIGGGDPNCTCPECRFPDDRDEYSSGRSKSDKPQSTVQAKIDEDLKPETAEREIANVVQTTQEDINDLGVLIEKHGKELYEKREKLKTELHEIFKFLIDFFDREMFDKCVKFQDETCSGETIRTMAENKCNEARQKQIRIKELINEIKDLFDDAALGDYSLIKKEKQEHDDLTENYNAEIEKLISKVRIVFDKIEEEYSKADRYQSALKNLNELAEEYCGSNSDEIDEDIIKNFFPGLTDLNGKEKMVYEIKEAVRLKAEEIVNSSKIIEDLTELIIKMDKYFFELLENALLLGIDASNPLSQQVAHICSGEYEHLIGKTIEIIKKNREKQIPPQLLSFIAYLKNGNVRYHQALLGYDILTKNIPKSKFAKD